MKLTQEKIGMLADIHIGLHSGSSMWHTITIDFAHWMKAQYKALGIKDIIILGDVLDNRNEIPVPTIHFMNEFFSILEDFNIIILVGNHDCFYNKRSDIHSLAPLDRWPNITIVDKPTTITLFGKVVTFCPWGTNIDDVPKCDVILGHFEIESFKMYFNRVCSRGIKTSNLLDKAGCIISGHFHVPETRTYKEGTITYLGSPYEQSWGEYATSKNIYVFDLENNSLSPIPNNESPKHRKINLSEIAALGKITDEIKKEFANNIVNFTIDMKVEQPIIEGIMAKLALLKPLELQTEYSTDEVIQSENIEEKTTNVEISDYIIAFVDSLENIEHKEQVKLYLLDVYAKAVKK